jgi:hypothetical protein
VKHEAAAQRSITNNNKKNGLREGLNWKYFEWSRGMVPVMGTAHGVCTLKIYFEWQDDRSAKLKIYFERPPG